MSREQAIEAAAVGYGTFPRNYLELTDKEKHEVRIRSAIAAFLDVMLDEEALANVIAHAGTDWEYEFIEYREGKGDDPGPSAEYVTRAVVAYLKGDSSE